MSIMLLRTTAPLHACRMKTSNLCHLLSAPLRHPFSSNSHHFVPNTHPLQFHKLSHIQAFSCPQHRQYASESNFPQKPLQKLYLTTTSKASITRSFSQEDVNAFASLSGDRNPIHIDRTLQNNYIKEKYGVKDKALVHGMLVASLISTVAGMVTPGEGSIYLKQSLNFEKPVFVGDVLEARVRLTRVVRSDVFAFETIVYNKTRQWNAITGDSLVMHPKVRGGKSPLDVLLFWFEGLSEVEQQLRLVLGEKRVCASKGVAGGETAECPTTPQTSLPVGQERWNSDSDHVRAAITMNFKDVAQTLTSSDEILQYWLKYMIPKHPECTLLATVILFSAMSRTMPLESEERKKYEQIALKLAKKAVLEDREACYEMLKLDLFKRFLLEPLQQSDDAEDQRVAAELLSKIGGEKE